MLHTDDLYRRTGRSTIIALELIASAMKNPGLRIRILDHHGTREANSNLLYMMVGMVDSLEFDGFVFNREESTITYQRNENARS